MHFVSGTNEKVGVIDFVPLSAPIRQPDPGGRRNWVRVGVRRLRRATSGTEIAVASRGPKHNEVLVVAGTGQTGVATLYLPTQQLKPTRLLENGNCRWIQVH